VEYTSQGFMILGRILELISGQRLDALLRETVFEPIGMDSTQFTPPPELHPKAAATEDCPWRHRIVQGEVHDENAVVMGGIAAHAGIFSTAGDVARLCQTMVSGGRGQRGRVLSPESVECMTRLHTGHLRLARCLGWQGKDKIGSPGGDLFSDRSYGHTGFTGTSVWIDPTLDLFAVLLTNRVHPSRQNEAVIRLRPLFHNVAAATWGGPDRE
jgi:CubicO group peptidase (beta-lactamase class C family)